MADTTTDTTTTDMATACDGLRRALRLSGADAYRRDYSAEWREMSHDSAQRRRVARERGLTSRG